MLEVGILYSDLTKAWTPLNNLSGLPSFTEVLTISITAERGNRAALCARMWSRQNNDIVAAKDLPWWGEDIYAIAIMPDDTFLTKQWAKEDEFSVARSINDGLTVGRVQLPSPFPPEAVVTIFNGGYLPMAEWRAALIVFENEMF